MIKYTNASGTHLLSPTMFPDGTSQVWKLNSPELIEKIYWTFQNESEVIQFIQLIHLVKESMTPKDYESLRIYIPFLPYARQDKMVSNDKTFALWSFNKLLFDNIPMFTFEGMIYPHVISYDVHNRSAVTLPNFNNIIPGLLIDRIIKEKLIDCVVYPDESAKKRYDGHFDNKQVFEITIVKKRDQSTGNIISHEIEHTGQIVADHFLLLDDLCDGGRTFISAAQLIKEKFNNSTLHLYTTHGIYSNGFNELLNHFETIHCTNSLYQKTKWFGPGNRVNVYDSIKE
jgi:ribose-phosphate pyrophosphokinase